MFNFFILKEITMAIHFHRQKLVSNFYNAFSPKYGNKFRLVHENEFWKWVSELTYDEINR